MTRNWRVNVWCGGAALLAALCPSAPSAGLEIPITYRRHTEEGRADAFQPCGIAGCRVQWSPPATGWKLPQTLSAHPLFATARLGDSEQLIVLDRKQASDPLPTRLFFDANANRDLSDDPPVDGKAAINGRNGSVMFSAVDCRLTVDGQSTPYSFQPSLECGDLKALKQAAAPSDADLKEVRFWLRGNCSYSGAFELGGRKYRLILRDADCNGRFTDYGAMPERSSASRARLSLTGDSLFLSAGSRLDYGDQANLARLLLLESALYDVRVDIPGERLVLTPTTEKLAPLKLSMPTQRLTLQAKEGGRIVVMREPATEAMLPPGEYRLVEYGCERKDEEGDLWRIAAAGSTQGPFVPVNGEKTALLKFGEPFAVAAGLSPGGLKGWSKGKEEVPLSFSLNGAGDEYVTDVSRIAGGQTKTRMSAGSRSRPQEPVYEIVKPDGEIVARGTFEYG